MQPSRQALFAGTEAPAPHLALNEQRLAAYLHDHLDPAIARLGIAKFRGGQSNPTYLIDAGGHRYILRRKPPGALVASAHDIEREYRVITAMSGTAVPVPRTYLYCHDTDVIGSEFYIAIMSKAGFFGMRTCPASPPSSAGLPTIA